MVSYTSPIRREVRGDRHHQIPLLHQTHNKMSINSLSDLYRRNFCRVWTRWAGDMQPHAPQYHVEKRGLTDVTVQIATWQKLPSLTFRQSRPAVETTTITWRSQHRQNKTARGPGERNHHLQARSTPAVEMAIDRDFAAT